MKRGVTVLRPALLLSLLSLGLIVPPSWAGSMAELRGDLRECLEIPSALRRLDCFDRLARQVTREPTQPDDAAPSAAARPPNAGAGPDAPEPQRNQPITSSIVQLEQRPRGEWVFHLDNGQIWTEVEPGRGRYQIDSDVRITRTLLGSYMLSADGGRTTRVRRID